MDHELSLHELARLEAERILRSIPAEVLETAWVREAQVEAVIDAVLAVALGADARAIVHARHVGEWVARIAVVLQYGPEPRFARRVGVLADVDPAALDRIEELCHLAPYVREYQAFAIAGSENPGTLSLIVAAADEFDERISPDASGCCPSPASVLRTMRAAVDETSRPIVEALWNAVHPAKGARVA